jgi:hypothetical protein
MDTIKRQKPFYKRWWVWVIAVFILLAAIGSSGHQATQSAVQAEQTTTSQPSSSAQKQYVEVAKFSGNGAKKSEPFTITGDKFKITYDCSGDPSATLCTAFVFKVGSPYPQGVMNVTHATKDETIIYTSMAGKGDYYLDANVLGSFTMTVYDYK